MNPRFRNLIFVITFGISCLFAQPKTELIDEVVLSYYGNNQFSGSVLVVENGAVIYRQSVGLANRDWNIPNTPDTKLRLASITKQFTAMVIMQLVEEGEIALHGTISDYLPYYRKSTGKKVTVHHLLTHTSGIPNYTSNPEFWTTKTRLHHDLKTLIKDYCSGTLEFKPGTRFRYNNSGYVILGAIIEEVSGRPYDVVIQDRIFDPLGMPASGFEHDYKIIPNLSSGYDYTYDGFNKSQFINLSAAHAAGGLYSTVDDLLLWDRALYTDKLISEENKNKLFTPFLDDYAYGIGVKDVMLPDSSRTVKLISHAGGINGYNSWIGRYVEEKNTIIVLCNQVPNKMHAMSQAIFRILYDQPYEQSKQRISEVVYGECQRQGIAAALELYRHLKETESDAYDFTEPELNTLGYYLLNKGDVSEAVEIFKLNVAVYPDASNTYDSLAEAYYIQKEKKLSLANYKKSLELNPDNKNAIRMLKKVRSLREKRARRGE